MPQLYLAVIHNCVYRNCPLFSNVKNRGGLSTKIESCFNSLIYWDLLYVAEWRHYPDSDFVKHVN